MKDNLLKRLYKGKIALYIVFWIWFVLFSFILDSLFGIGYLDLKYKLIEIDNLDFLIYTFTVLYSFFIFVIVIKTANRYKGSKFFSFFSKVFVTVSLIFSLISFIDIAKLQYFEDYSISLEIESLKDDLPIKVNSYTKLKDVNKDDKIIEYTFEIMKKNIKNNKSIRLNRFKDDVQGSLCEDETTLELLKKDYILNYKYVTLTNEEIINIRTNKESCGPGIYDYEILKELFIAEGLI